MNDKFNLDCQSYFFKMLLRFHINHLQSPSITIPILSARQLSSTVRHPRRFIKLSKLGQWIQHRLTHLRVTLPQSQFILGRRDKYISRKIVCNHRRIAQRIRRRSLFTHLAILTQKHIAIIPASEYHIILARETRHVRRATIAQDQLGLFVQHHAIIRMTFVAKDFTFLTNVEMVAIQMEVGGIHFTVAEECVLGVAAPRPVGGNFQTA